MGLVVPTNSWVTEAEANAYMADRLKASLYWTDVADDNAPALITAWYWLNAGNFAFPDDVTTAMKTAQYEQALFLLQQQPDIDLRLGLQVQGVIVAGVVKEKYKNDNYVEIAFPPIVQKLLEDYQTSKPIFLIDLARNENQGVGYDAWGNLPNDTAENR